MGLFAAAMPKPDSEAARKSAEAYAQARPNDDGQGEAVGDATFGDFTGSFSAQISDEDQKVNVQRLEYALGGGRLSTFVQLRSMIDGPKYDFLFDEEDANRQKFDRNETLLALKDFIDNDDQQSQLDPTNALNPFVPGFGDENAAYQRHKRRYKAKNAKFDSLDEVRMVSGASDAFMAAFGDRLTVWPDVNSKLNINTDDPLQMLINIMTAARNPMDPLLNDPMRLQLIMMQINLVKMFPFIGLSVGTFASIVEGNGIQVRPEIKTNSAQNVFLGDKSTTFRIVATGEAGRVKKTLTAIVRYDAGLGQVLYWNER
jgi:general secretion pathway protein K